MPCPTSDLVNPELISTRKDVKRLNWQRAILGLIGFGVLLILDIRKSTLTLLMGWLAFLIGILILGVYMLFGSNVRFILSLKLCV
jgi:hypothetical protein